MRTPFCISLLLFATLGPTFASPTWTAQGIDLGQAGLQGAQKRKHVELLTQAVQFKAGQSTWVELRFRVEPGMHVNSHAPHDETLIPTAFEMDRQSSLTMLSARYPAGLPLRLDVGSGETLSTYQGEFTVQLQLRASAAVSVLSGILHYQACNARSCFPPRNLPVRVNVTAH